MDVPRPNRQDALDLRQSTHGIAPQRPRRWLVIFLSGAVVAVLGTGVAVAATRRDGTDEAYLRALRANWLRDQFNSDANAIAHAKSVCRALDDGGAQQGLRIDEIAAQHYCAKFAQGFHVLQTVTVSGTFDLFDASLYESGIAMSGGTCTGTGGYADIGAGTSVVVKDGADETITTTILGAGTGTSTSCSFTFGFDVVEGRSDYVVSVSHRGEQHYTFAQLQTSGVHLTLGR